MVWLVFGEMTNSIRKQTKTFTNFTFDKGLRIIIWFTRHQHCCKLALRVCSVHVMDPFPTQSNDGDKHDRFHHSSIIWTRKLGHFKMKHEELYGTCSETGVKLNMCSCPNIVSYSDCEFRSCWLWWLWWSVEVLVQSHAGTLNVHRPLNRDRTGWWRQAQHVSCLCTLHPRAAQIKTTTEVKNANAIRAGEFAICCCMTMSIICCDVVTSFAHDCLGSQWISFHHVRLCSQGCSTSRRSCNDDDRSDCCSDHADLERTNTGAAVQRILCDNSYRCGKTWAASRRTTLKRAPHKRQKWSATQHCIPNHDGQEVLRRPKDRVQPGHRDDVRASAASSPHARIVKPVPQVPVVWWDRAPSDCRSRYSRWYRALDSTDWVCLCISLNSWLSPASTRLLPIFPRLSQQVGITQDCGILPTRTSKGIIFWLNVKKLWSSCCRKFVFDVKQRPM